MIREFVGVSKAVLFQEAVAADHVGGQRNREAWLADLLTLLRPRFTALPLALPEQIAITCGWPSQGGIRRVDRVIGQCWRAEASTLRRPEIFVSPLLDQPVEVVAVVLHELIHAALPDAGHGAAFRRAALALGLSGPMTATILSGPLINELSAPLHSLGPYPHGRIRVAAATLVPGRKGCPHGHKKEGTRLLRVACPTCGYLVRTTAKWLGHGVPTCPCGTAMERTS